jgi:chemotaxis regulatin CheY-phosphate phosphatase CheZ
MTPEQRARLEEQVGTVEETTEQRMHAVADLLPDSDDVHERADQLTERSKQHFRRARLLRRSPD